jgi:hypothetical protein
MSLSETVIAALIGAAATVGTALFQLLRARGASEAGRPRRSRWRSAFAIVALMLVAAAGGFAWSELRSLGAREEISALRQDLAAQIQALARAAMPTAVAHAPSPIAQMPATRGVSEAIVRLPPCRLPPLAEEAGPAACSEAAEQRVTLCTIVPDGARTTAVRVLARAEGVEDTWTEREPGSSQIGPVHLSSDSTAAATAPASNTICLDAANWSLEATQAVRLLVEHGPGAPSG